MKHIRPFALLGILTLAFLFRLYHLDRPVGDWHSWRQADTAAVTRRYLKEGIDLLHPKYDDLSNIPSGLDNPAGYRMVEFPFLNALVAATYPAFSPWLNLETFHRLVSVLFSLGSVLALYALVAFLEDERTALLAAAIFAVLPFNVFYSSTILPEPAFVFFTLASIAFWLRYTQKTSVLLLAGFTLAAAAAMLLKPYYVFFVPALIYYYVRHRGLSGFKNWHLYLSAAVILAPFFWWRNWITQFPSGIPSSSWLFNSTGIRFRPAWFRWLFADRFGRLILGYWGLLPFGLGLALRPSVRTGWFYHWWLAGVLLYFSVLATGNVTHDYYQVITLPVLAIFSALGINFLLKAPKQFSPFLTYALVLVVSLFSLSFSWFHIRDYYNINNPAIVAAGQAADRLLPPDALVIAPYGGDTAFLYQTNRSGWPIGFEIPDKIAQGAGYYVSTSLDDEARWLIDRCRLLDQTDQYQLIDLSGCDF